MREFICEVNEYEFLRNSNVPIYCVDTIYSCLEFFTGKNSYFPHKQQDSLNSKQVIAWFNLFLNKKLYQKVENMSRDSLSGFFLICLNSLTYVMRQPVLDYFKTDVDFSHLRN